LVLAIWFIFSSQGCWYLIVVAWYVKLVGTCKMSLLVEVGTLGCLSKYRFKRKKKVQWYFREIDSENVYDKNFKNDKIINLELERLMGFFIAHKSCPFIKRKG